MAMVSRSCLSPPRLDSSFRWNDEMGGGMAACVLLAGNEYQRYMFFFRLSEVNVRRAVVGTTGG